MDRLLVHRRWLAGMVAFALLTAFSAPALANGNSSKTKVNVRVKNFRANPVAVAVANKNPTAFRSLNSLQATQFKVNQGKFVVDDQVTRATFNTGKRKTVYIALTDAGIEDTTTKF
jgi:hypothetical protein